MRKVILLLIVILNFRNNAIAGDEYLKNLERIISSIETGSGILKIDLNPGLYRKNLNGINTFLQISPQTYSTAEIQIRQGKIFSINYIFSKPILFINGSDVDCNGLYVRSFKFIDNVLKIDSFSTSATRDCGTLNQRIARKMMTVFIKPQNLNNLINGSLFSTSNYSIWDSCKVNFGNCTNPKKLVRAVNLLKNNTYPNGFFIKFREDSKILLGDSSNYYNYVITGKSDSVLISELSFIPEGKDKIFTISGDLSSLKAGLFQSKGCTLEIKNPKIKNLLLTIRTSGTSGTTNFNVDLTGIINSPSFMNIGEESASSKIFIGDNSKVDIKDISLMSLDNNNTHLKIGIGSSLNLEIDSARLILNNATTLLVTKSSFKDSRITAEFFSEKRQSFFQGSLFDVTLKIDSGHLALNDFSNLTIKSGNVHANSLEVNTTTNPLIRGRFDAFRIDFLPGNMFKASDNNFVFTCDDAFYIEQETVDPVRFEKDELFPLGSIKYNLKFKQFTVNQRKDFVLSDGVFTGIVSYLGRGQYSGRSMRIKGDFNTRVTFNKQFNVSAGFDLDDGRLVFSKRFGPEFSAKLNFSLGPMASPIPVKTPCQDDAELNFDGFQDEHLYPITVNVNVDKPIIFKNMKISFKNDKVDDFAGVSDPTSLHLEIPPGFGEYDPDHDDCNEISSNVSNKDRGADDIKDKQEAGRATSNLPVIPNCTIHTWLDTASYLVNYKINFEYKISTTTSKPVVVIRPNLDIGGVAIKYIRHGCDDVVRATIAGFFVNVDDTISGKIREAVDKVAERISQGIAVNF